LKRAVLLALAPIFLHARTTEEADVPEFWSTGPLLAPSGDIVDPGHAYYEPFVYWVRQDGAYDAHWKPRSRPLFTSLALQPEMRIGIVEDIEFDVNPIVIYNHTRHAAHWAFGDIPVSFNFLLCQDESWTRPNLLLRLAAILPVGKYQKLDPSKKGTDSGGMGSWYPGIGLIYYHLQHFWGSHYLSTTAYAAYQFGTPASVKGVSVYGGGPDASGTAYAGNTLLGIVSFEFSLTQNWVLALDTQYQHFDHSRFKGHTGGVSATTPSSEQFSLAPALEYNWSKNVGIIGGVWFTAAGRRAARFASGLLAVTINC